MKKILTLLTAVPLAVGLGALGTGAAHADSEDLPGSSRLGSSDVGELRTYDGPLDDALGSLDDLDDLVPHDIARQINAFLGQWGVQLPIDVDDDWDDRDDRDDRDDDDGDDDRWDD